MLSSEYPMYLPPGTTLPSNLARRNSARVPSTTSATSSRNSRNVNDRDNPPPPPSPVEPRMDGDRGFKTPLSGRSSNGDRRDGRSSPYCMDGSESRHCGSGRSSPRIVALPCEQRERKTGIRKDQPTHFHSGSWHTASCKFPSSRYVAPAEVDSYTPSPRQVPTICVTSDRRTSISSVLRFTRTFSTDSIDSLEKQCLKEVRRQRVLMEEEAQTSALGLLTAHSTPSYPSLSHVGRSKTDPETPPEGSSKHPPMLGRPMHGQSFDYSKISAVDAGLKRSNPELAVDILKSRTLKDVIGISAYQAKLLLQCWPNIYATGTSGMFASQLYGNLTRRNPKAKVIMQKADGVAVFSQSGTDCTAMHNKLTLDLIDNIIRNLDNSPANIVGYLTEIGQGHKTLKDEGMSIALWDDFGDAILDGVRKNDLVRRHKELRRAWLAIIAFITDNIKSGHSTFRASTSSNDLNNVDKTAPTNGTSRNGCPMSNPDGKKTP